MQIMPLNNLDLDVLLYIFLTDIRKLALSRTW